MSVIHLSTYQVMRIAGQNAASFLQGQLTNDVLALNENNFQLTAYCNPQGRIWCIGRLWKQDDQFYYLVPKEVIMPMMTDLNKYAQFSKVAVSVATEYHVLGMIGEGRDIQAPYKMMHLDDKRDIAIVSEPTASQYSDQAIYEWELAEIQAGIPNVWKETITQFLPHDVQLTELQGVSFTKGCYKGQEIIARMEYRGKRKKNLYYVKCSSVHPLHPNDVIQDAEHQPIGYIVSAALNAQREYECLAILPEAIVENKAYVKEATIYFLAALSL